jgi:hypothetical protein
MRPQNIPWIFKRKSTETIAPAPVPVDPLTAAIAEEFRTSALVHEASAACKALDEEKKSWDQRRGAAQKQIERCIGLHLIAKDAVAKLSAPASDLVASGNVVPAVVGAVVGEG